MASNCGLEWMSCEDWLRISLDCGSFYLQGQGVEGGCASLRTVHSQQDAMFFVGSYHVERSMHYNEVETLLRVGPRSDYADAHLHDRAKEEEPITPPARGSGSCCKKPKHVISCVRWNEMHQEKSQSLQFLQQIMRRSFGVPASPFSGGQRKA